MTKEKLKQIIDALDLDIDGCEIMIPIDKIKAFMYMVKEQNRQIYDLTESNNPWELRLQHGIYLNGWCMYIDLDYCDDFGKGFNNEPYYWLVNDGSKMEDFFKLFKDN
jgi:hypothetical protein